ncbi:radical SAM protein [Sphingobacterium anhuiense]|uniref:radical SAM protein n=1 Tax=Sphingobacterium anhuiense TaxID=493780 RepID=UPI003C2E6117
MKFSQFNTEVAYNNKYVLFNALQNHFLYLNPLIKELIDACRAHDDIAGLEKLHPTLFNVLKEKGFIVENDYNELQEVISIREKVDLENETFFHLTINPTMNCNFSCWYCYESHEKNSKMEFETIEKIKAFIESKINASSKIKKFHIAWFGGEPLLYFGRVIVPIIEFTSELCLKFGVEFDNGFTTNGLLINLATIEALKPYPITSFQITLDGGREEHNSVRFVNEKRGSYDEIVANIKLLCEHKRFTTLRINYTTKNLPSVVNIANDFDSMSMQHREYLSITFHKVWQEENTDLQDTVSSLIKYFRSKGLNALVGGLPDNLRNSCYADKKNHATVNYNGDLFKCTARDFTSSSSEGFIGEDGTLVWNETYYKRLDAKFKNKPCLTCSILPICNGGCSQVALENEGKDYCVHNFDENSKRRIVLEKFLKRTSVYV